MKRPASYPAAARERHPEDEEVTGESFHDALL